MRVELVITIVPGGAPLTLAELATRLPELSLRIGETLERGNVHFTGHLEVDDESEESRDALTRHLTTLRRFSATTSGATITIAALPDGGVLTLCDGSFGEDDEEVSSVLGRFELTPSKLYLSFRIEPDAHEHLQRLIERATSEQAVFDSSPTTLAVGFDVPCGWAALPNILADVRLAWRQEGSECQCLVEVEGPRPVTTLLRGWSDWIDLERSLRRTDEVTEVAAPVKTEHAVALGDVPVGRALHDMHLSWIDAEDQILCLADDKLYSLPDRVEASKPGRGQLLRRAGGSLLFVLGEKVVELPHAPENVDRKFHALCWGGALFTETRASRTQLIQLGSNGLAHGPTFDQVCAVDADSLEAFVLARGRAGFALFAVELGRGWGYTDTQPWRADDTPADVAVLSNSRVAVAAARGSSATLYLVERANLQYARELALPCTNPQIIAHGGHCIWLTGTSPAASKRCDLFRVDLLLGSVTSVTAELADTSAIDAVANQDGSLVLFATARAVYLARSDARGAPVEILELTHEEKITGMVVGKTTAVCLQTPRACRLVIGRREVVVPLQVPAFEPKL
jgi:hypothetical protein